MFVHFKKPLAAVAVTCSLIIAGCGGSGSSESGTIDAADITWTEGVFEPSSKFDQQCQALNEKHWLRAWSHETYLWYDEIADNDPENFATVADYFAQLKTEELTDSGDKKDNFHFSEPSEDYFQEAQSGVTSGYGINWAFIGDPADRILRVAYLEDDSPASQIGFQRGDTVLEVDGVSINTSTQAGVDTLNEGLFSPTNGDSHTIVVRSNNGAEKTFNVTAGNIEQTPVQNVKTITTANGTSVGYMQFNSHIGIAQEGLIAAVNKFKTDNVEELVIDFRYNGGGLLALSSQLAYMVAGSANIQNRIYYQTQQNDKQPVESPFPFIDEEIDYSTFFSTGESLPDLNLSKVYVLSTSGTCSASEAFINGLKGIDAEVVLIGDTTCGKPYGFTPTHNCGTTYYTIQFSGINSKGFGEYAAGFTPTPTPQFDADVKGCVVSDDFDNQLGNPNEGLLSTALYHIDNNGTCPVSTASASIKTQVQSAAGDSKQLLPLNAPNNVNRGNMDLTWPTLNKDK